MSLRRSCAIWGCAAAGVMLAGLAAAGCTQQSAGPQRASVGSCIQFGISAIKHRVTVTSLPAACQGLTRAQVDFAVGSALHVMAIGPGGKVGERKRVAQFSPFLARLAATVPEQPSQPPVPAPPVPAPPASAPAARPAGRTTLGLIALITWLITVGLGAAMMARWIARGGLRQARAGHARFPAPMIFAHFGLAITGLAAWISYLVTGVTSVAWIASALLLPVTGLGMAVLLASRPERSLADDPPPVRHPPAIVVAAHGAFAVATLLFVILAAIGR
jgi:hypothetical protein